MIEEFILVAKTAIVLARMEHEKGNPSGQASGADVDLIKQLAEEIRQSIESQTPLSPRFYELLKMPLSTGETALTFNRSDGDLSAAFREAQVALWKAERLIFQGKR